MEDMIYQRLVSLGYVIDSEVGEGGKVIYHPAPADEMIIRFSLDKETETIKSECNTDSIPDELTCRAIDHVVGEFLLNKKTIGQLVIDDIDFSSAEKSIQEGDTNIQFADGSSPAEMLNVFISFLMKPIDFSDYRRIRW